MAPEIALLQRYFGFGRVLASQGQIRQMAGGMLDSGIARGAQVLGFKSAELADDWTFAAPPAVPKPRREISINPGQSA